jgi:hypothetical protein
MGAMRHDLASCSIPSANTHREACQRNVIRFRLRRGSDDRKIGLSLCRARSCSAFSASLSCRPSAVVRSLDSSRSADDGARVNKASYLVLSVGFFVETSLALGQTPTAMSIAQETGTMPPSGTLITSPPAPVAVPSSGALADDRHPISALPFTALPFTADRRFRVAKRIAVPPNRHHNLHLAGTQRRRMTGTQRRRSPAPSPPVESAILPMVDRESAEQPREGTTDGFLFPFGKSKE